MARQPVGQSTVIQLFEEIQAAFPRLSMRLDTEPQHVDLDMTIRRQPGLGFDVNRDYDSVIDAQLHRRRRVHVDIDTMRLAECRQQTRRERHRHGSPIV